MSRPMITIVNCETNDSMDREMTEAEYEQHKVIMADRAKDEADKKANSEAKAALLTKLGITAEEAVLLLS